MSNRRLLERAQRLEIEQKFPELKRRGIRTEAQRREEVETNKLDIEAARELARKRAIELEGATTGQAAPATTGQAAPAPGFTGVAGKTAGFSNATDAGFSGVSGSRVGFNRDSPTATPTGTPPRRETFAEEDARTRREKTLSGAFGERAQNLEQRRGLFAEMKAGGIDSATARERAKTLGVDDKGFNTAVARIEGVDMTPSATPTPAPAAPLTGRALAESNIATMGQAGAVADYFKRAGAKETAKQSKQIDAPVNYRSGESRSASASATPSFSSMFRREVDGGAAPVPATPAAPRAGSDANAGYRGDDTRLDLDTAKIRTRVAESQGRIPDYQDRMQAGFVSGRDIAKAAAPAVAAAARFRPSQLPRVAITAAQNRSGDMLASARGFVERTNEASDLFGKNLRKQLGIQ